MDLCPEPLWEELCRADPTCTFYQTPAWQRIGARYYGAEITPLLFQCAGGPACLPLLKKKRWGVDRYFNPFGTYSSLVSAGELKAEDRAFISRRLGALNLHLISSPFTRNEVGAGKVLRSRVQVIDLRTLDPENPMDRWHTDQRRRVRVGQRHGIRIRTAETPEEWERHYALYQLSLERWGRRATSVYPPSLFEDIRNSLSGTAARRLWVVEHRGEIGASCIAFYYNRHVVPWHAAADRRFFQFGATQSIFLAMIVDAFRRGFETFDLTGSGGLTRVEYFKSQLGTRYVEFNSYLNRPGLPGFLSGLRDAVRNLGRGGRARRDESILGDAP